MMNFCWSGNVKNGFIAQFIPNAVGLHVVLVEYNGIAVGGTPFYSKAGPITETPSSRKIVNKAGFLKRVG